MQYSIKNYRRISRYYEEIQIAINGYTMYNFDHFTLNQILPNLYVILEDTCYLELIWGAFWLNNGVSKVSLESKKLYIVKPNE